MYNNNDFVMLFNEQVDATGAALLEQTAGGQQPLQKDEGQQLPASAEQFYEVKVNGQTHKVPLPELLSGYSRQQDYTAKTMQLAQERQRYEQEISTYQQQLEQVRTFLSDPRVVTALRNLQAGIVDPSQPPTAEQLQQLMASQGQQQQAALREQMEAMAQEMEIRSLAAQYGGEINSTIKQLLDKHTILQDIDGIDQLLRNDVSQKQPANLEEAKRLFVEAAESRANRLMSRFQNQQKDNAVQQAKLVKNGIEAGGIAPQTLQPEKKFKLGSNDLFQAAVSDLMQTALNK